MTTRLRGHTAIVALDSEGSEDLARRLAREGAKVVVVTADGERDGRQTASMEADGLAPAAVFCLDPGTGDQFDALVELVTELGARSSRVAPAPEVP